MGITIRYLIASYSIVALLLAWWFPAPVLIRGELVNWAIIHESPYASSRMLWGSMKVSGASVNSMTEPMPLTEFIAKNTEGLTFRAADAVWAGVFAALDQELAPERLGVKFFKPENSPFNEINDGFRYVEWRDEHGIRYIEYRYIPASEFGKLAIPDDIRFPLRIYWSLLLGGVLIIGYWGFFQRQSLGILESSSAATGIRITIVLTAIFSGMVLGPFFCQTIDSEFGIISVIIGGFFLLLTTVLLWVFGRQAFTLYNIIKNDQYLAHFTFGIKEWTNYAESKFAQDSSTYKLVWLVAFVIGSIGVGFVVVERNEASLWVLVGFLVFMVFFSGIALIPWLTYRQNCRRPGEVYIGEFGCYINGSVHSWNSSSARFESAEFKIDPAPHILVTLSQPGRRYYDPRTNFPLDIPVPVGQERIARKVAEQLVYKHHDK